MPIPVRAKLLPGKPDLENKGAIDWKKQNLLAIGCQSYIVVYETETLNIIQTLDEHKAKVTVVRW